MAEFTDSVEATEFLYGILNQLKDPRVQNWVKLTMENYAVPDLAFAHEEAVVAVTEFLEILDQAS